VPHVTEQPVDGCHEILRCHNAGLALTPRPYRSKTQRPDRGETEPGAAGD
jgi:hypothetical protein